MLRDVQHAPAGRTGRDLRGHVGRRRRDVLELEGDDVDAAGEARHRVEIVVGAATSTSATWPVGVSVSGENV